MATSICEVGLSSDKFIIPVHLLDIAADPNTLAISYSCILLKKWSFLCIGTKLLESISKANSLSEIDQKMSSMEEIFQLQQMYDIKKQEKEIEENLKKLGYVKWMKIHRYSCLNFSINMALKVL